MMDPDPDALALLYRARLTRSLWGLPASSAPNDAAGFQEARAVSAIREGIRRARDAATARR